MNVLWAVIVTSIHELSRRRVALLFVMVLPLVFYLVRIDVPWQALRFLAIGVGWAIATLALFSHVGARRIDQRLSVIGASPSALFFGRQLAVIAVGLVVALIYFAVVALTQEVPRLPAVALLLVTTVLISAPLGALASLVLPRELEGALALLSVMALQLLVDPAARLAVLMPLWSTRELGAYAIEPVGDDRLALGLAHWIVAMAVLVVIAWVAAVARLRPVKLAAPRSDESAGRLSP